MHFNIDNLPFSLIRENWNPDGVTKVLPKWNARATHYPKMGYKAQRVVIEHDGKVYTQRFQNEKWSETMVKEQ